MTRFEHSLGVMHVLQALGAGLDEQVAGLLHDVPHTAFSHTVDIVFPSDEHNFHERFQHDVIMGSDIPEILAKYGVSLRAALEPDDFPLLEQPLPDLCADRLDYSLRDLQQSERLTPREAQAFLGRLVPTPVGIAIDNAEVALWFARLYLVANDTLWTGAEEAGSYWALAQAIRRGYSLDSFTDDDLFSTDDAAMGKLRSLGDLVIDGFLSLLEPGTEYYEVTCDAHYFETHMKQRAVDPLVWEPGWREPLRLSEIYRDFGELVTGQYASRTIRYRLWSPRMTEELLSAARELTPDRDA
jgi:uncharacterized protein